MSKEDKSRFHALADEAQKEHLAKYPGYYYSPLEARMAKADRKKKHYEKMNSKRGYCKQQSSSSLTAGQTSSSGAKSCVQSSQPAVFSSSTTFDALEKTTNERNPKYPPPALESPAYPNSKLSPGCAAVCTSSTVNSQSFDVQRTNMLPNVLQPHHPTGFHHNADQYNNQLKQTSKFDPNRFAQSQPELQLPGHSIQPSRNVLFCSQTVQNSVMQLLNFPNTSENDLDSSRFFSQAPGFGQSFNGTLYHHCSSNGYPAPTVFHVTSKDPNLNSTLTTADGMFANIQLSSPDQIPNSGIPGTNLNSMTNQSHSFFLTNQFVQQQQQLHQQQPAPKNYNQTEAGSFSPFLPQID